jgi:hypothetical protein
MSNNVPGIGVELHAGSQVWRATTDADGRALFESVPPGTSVHAVTTLDGQTLESRDFSVPAEGGMRVVLVASAAGGAARPPGAPAPGPAAGAAPGTVALGGQSRVLVELIDGAVEVYYLFEVDNAGTTPVATEPLVFRLPSGARNTTVLGGSEGHARAEGPVVTVTGPFAPGRTSVQFAYQRDYSGSRVVLEQALPVAMTSTAVIVRKIGDLAFTSPQTPNQGPMTQGNAAYVIGNGPGIAAGGTLQIDLTGLPHRSTWPRNLALALSLLIIGAGAWIATSGDTVVESHRQKLETRREQLLTDLVKLEEQYRARRGDAARYTAKRRDLVEQLERIYAELEALAAA